MRLAGTLSTEAEAQRLADYLLTLGISTRAIAEGSAWGLWVRDDAQLERGKEELAAFVADPQDPRYVRAAGEATSLRQMETSREAQARRNLVQMKELWRRPAPRNAPLVAILILASIGVTIYTGFGGSEARKDFIEKLYIADEPREQPTYSLEAVGRGEFWRLVTPIFLHLSLMHLIFNMSMLYQLGSAVETIDGSWRFGLLVLALAVLSNVGQFYFHWIDNYLVSPQAVQLDPLPFFGGMSGVIYGLFGYIWMRARKDRTSRYHMDDQTVVIMLGWFFLCLFGLVGPIANTAHAAGLIVGMAVGYAVAKWRWNRAWKNHA